MCEDLLPEATGQDIPGRIPSHLDFLTRQTLHARLILCRFGVGSMFTAELELTPMVLLSSALSRVDAITL
jgi:hypothetical protein